VEIRLDHGAREYLGASATLDDLLDGRNIVDLNALVVERAVLDEVGGFDTALRRWVDYDLVLRIIRRHELAYVPVIGVVYDHRASAGDRITTSQSALWRNVVLNKHLVDWTEVQATLPERVTGRTSVVLRSRGQWAATLETVRELLHAADADDVDVEIIVVDNGSPRDESAILTAAFLAEPRVTVCSVAADLRTPTSANVAFGRSTGDLVVVVRPGFDGASVCGTIRDARSRPADAPMPGSGDDLYLVPAHVLADHGGFSPMIEGDPTGEVLQLRR
jgi:hypothetical protein